MSTGIRDWLIHEDDDLIALDKPAGLLSVPGRGPDKTDCLSERARQVWPDALIVHRLDQATSGLMLLARSPSAQRLLSAAFAQRQVLKLYEAIVHGRLDLPADAEPDRWGEIDLPLSADWPNRPRSKVDPVAGKPSLTRWQPLAYDAAQDRTRLLLAPVTGRSHQLRVHLLTIGHSIVGDRLYGPDDGAARLMLHASALQLQHPLTGSLLSLRSQQPF